MPFPALRSLLEKRIAIIADHGLRDSDPEAQLAQLQEVSEAIAAEASRLGDEAPPRLRHFLENASYQKALDFLGED